MLTVQVPYSAQTFLKVVLVRLLPPASHPAALTHLDFHRQTPISAFQYKIKTSIN